MIRTRTKGQPYITDGISDSKSLKSQRLVRGVWQDLSVWYPLNRSGLVKDYTVCKDELHAGPPYKVGGILDLRNSKANYEPLVNSGTWDGGLDYAGYPLRLTGGFSFNNSLVGLPSTALLNQDTRMATVQSTYGTKAWNKFRPAQAEAGLGQFIAELRDLPQMLKTSASLFYKKWRSMGGRRTLRSTPKSVANHWLNTQFGWVPFLSDFRNFHKLTKNLSSRLDHLKRDNGQWVRRGGTVTTDSAFDLVGGSSTQTRHYPVALGSKYINSSNTGSNQIYFSESSRIWFVARFKYWIPQLVGPDWQGFAVKRLYGLEITPTLIYELTPWSWLVDWFADVGDSLSLAQAQLTDNLCAKYAYLMETREKKMIIDSTLALKQESLKATFVIRQSQKLRNGASPFGFGIEPINFSARQFSILGALGLTRLL